MAAGFRSVHAVPMRPRGRIIGGLNQSRSEAGAMDDSAVLTAQAMADVATIAILQHRAASEGQALNEQLNLALNSRIVIEQAKGVWASPRFVEASSMRRRDARDTTEVRP